MKKLPPLEELLSYKNHLVIKRFKRNHPALQDQAEFLFIDMLKYLWLSQKHQMDNIQYFLPTMHKEMVAIDEMWHTFILITKDYAEFCNHFFGEFLHHVPEVGEHSEHQPIMDKERFEKEFHLFLCYVYDNLGEETVRSWFAVYLNDSVV